jgi:hypothetical protein
MITQRKLAVNIVNIFLINCASLSRAFKSVYYEYLILAHEVSKFFPFLQALGLPRALKTVITRACVKKSVSLSTMKKTYQIWYLMLKARGSACF